MAKRVLLIFSSSSLPLLSCIECLSRFEGVSSDVSSLGRVVDGDFKKDTVVQTVVTSLSSISCRIEMGNYE